MWVSSSGKKLDEIATHLDRSINSIKQALFRGVVAAGPEAVREAMRRCGIEEAPAE